MENKRENLNAEKWSDDYFSHVVLNIETRDISCRLNLQINGQKYMDTVVFVC